MDTLSQEEIEQLMEGTLPEERKKEVFEEQTQAEPKEEIEQAATEEITASSDVSEIQETEGMELDKKALKKKVKEERIAAKKRAKEEKLAARKKAKEEKLASKANTEVENKPENKSESQVDSNTEETKENAKLLNKINAPSVAQAINNVSTSLLTKIVIGLLVLVIIMAGLLTYVILQKNKLEALSKVKVKVPEYTANTTNYIFISQTKAFKGEDLKLVKMIIDPTATIFYFDKEFDFMSCEADLKDKDGKLYNIDLSFNTSNNVNNFIRFEPLDEGVKEFTLTLSDPYADEAVDYNIVLNSLPKVIPARYLDKQIKLEDKSLGTKLTLENATFSSANSILEYSLSGGELGFNNSNLEVSLTDSDGNILNNNQHIYSFSDGELIVGRTNFERVNNLNSNLDIKFDNIYKTIDINQQINSNTLPASDVDESNQFKLDLNGYTLYLEKFGDFGEVCIGTYHIKDSKGNLVSGNLETELIIDNQKGVSVTIDGICDSASVGGDLKFDLAKSQDILAGFETKVYTLNLKSMGLKLPAQIIELDLSKLNDTDIQTDKKEVSDFIIDISKKRLALKSGQINQSELNSYFEPSILQKSVTDYQPVSNLTEEAQYSSQIVTMAKSNNKYYAVVQDIWKGNTDDKHINFYRLHKIIVENRNNTFIITEDDIVR